VDPLALFFSVLKASAFSVGGLSSLPLLRDELVIPGFVTEQEVVESLAIGRLSTGPNGLYVVSLGYFAYGWVGAGIALLAATLPPLLIVPAAALIRKQLLTPWAAGMVRGVTLSTCGLLLATAYVLLAPGTTIANVPLWQLGLALGAAAITMHGRTHPALLILGGAVIGLAVGR
jgi:chromate transporter